MMIPWDKWQKALHDWAAEWTPAGADKCQVVWAEQETNAPQPKRPFVKLQVLSTRKRGEDGFVSSYDSTLANGKQLQQAQYGTRELRINVQVFANAKGRLLESAFARAQELADSLDNPTALEPLVEAGLGVTNVGEVQDLSEIEQSQYAGRASFDVRFEGAAVQEGAVSGQYIQRVIGEGDVEGNSDPEVTFDVTG